MKSANVSTVAKVIIGAGLLGVLILFQNCSVRRLEGGNADLRSGLSTGGTSGGTTGGSTGGSTGGGAAGNCVIGAPATSPADLEVGNASGLPINPQPGFKTIYANVNKFQSGTVSQLSLGVTLLTRCTTQAELTAAPVCRPPGTTTSTTTPPCVNSDTWTAGVSIRCGDNINATTCASIERSREYDLATTGQPFTLFLFRSKKDCANPANDLSESYSPPLFPETPSGKVFVTELSTLAAGQIVELELTDVALQTSGGAKKIMLNGLVNAKIVTFPPPCP